MEEKEQLIAIPLEEYAELIEDRTKLNAVYGLLTAAHTESISATGKKADGVRTDMLQVVSGYEENDNYFKYLREKFMRRNSGCRLN